MLSSKNKPSVGALAVACPILGDSIQFTNLPWQFSIQKIKTAFSLDSLFVINDYEAIAKALPYLETSDLKPVGTFTTDSTASEVAKVVLGPGSGLGCAGLVPYTWNNARHWVPVPGEAGHITLSPQNSQDDNIIAYLRKTLGHASSEDILSGPGIVNLYNAVLSQKISMIPAFIDIDKKNGDILPPGSKPYPNELNFSKFEGISDISIDGKLPKIRHNLVDAIVPKDEMEKPLDTDINIDSFRNLTAPQIALMALKAQNMTPSALFQKNLPTLPENIPKEILNIAKESMDYFFQFLGNIAGNLALTFGAKGGVYLAGGILPQIEPLLTQSTFRTFFQAKGSYSQYLSSVPSYLILHPTPALIGLARLVWEKLEG